MMHSLFVLLFTLLLCGFVAAINLTDLQDNIIVASQQQGQYDTLLIVNSSTAELVDSNTASWKLEVSIPENAKQVISTWDITTTSYCYIFNYNISVHCINLQTSKTESYSIPHQTSGFGIWSISATNGTVYVMAGSNSNDTTDKSSSKVYFLTINLQSGKVAPYYNMALPGRNIIIAPAMTYQLTNGVNMLYATVTDNADDDEQDMLAINVDKGLYYMSDIMDCTWNDNWLQLIAYGDTLTATDGEYVMSVTDRKCGASNTFLFPPTYINNLGPFAIDAKNQIYYLFSTENGNNHYGINYIDIAMGGNKFIKCKDGKSLDGLLYPQVLTL